MTEIVNVTGFHPPRTLPDHSILIRTFNTSIFDLMKAENLQKIAQFDSLENYQLPTRKPIKDHKK